jgi:single-strand DNA-binding protein
MASFNKVVLMGNLTRDPEVRQLASGTAVGDLGVAINERYKDKDGAWQEKPVFVDVTAWGKTAENCDKYLNKGSAVLIEGRLQFDQWETDDGQKRSKLKVVADNVQFIGGKSKSKDGPAYKVVSKDDPDDDLPY